MVKQFTERQVDDIIRMKFGKMVTSADNVQYASNETLGQIYGVSSTKIRELYMQWFQQALGPLEMEIIEGKLDLSWANSRAGDHVSALEQLRQARLYAPKQEAHRLHFDMVTSLAAARAYRCANLLQQAQAEYERGLGLAGKR